LLPYGFGGEFPPKPLSANSELLECFWTDLARQSCRWFHQSRRGCPGWRPLSFARRARGIERNVKPGVLVGMFSRLSLAIIALSFALLIGALVLTVFTF